MTPPGATDASDTPFSLYRTSAFEESTPAKILLVLVLTLNARCVLACPALNVVSRTPASVYRTSRAVGELTVPPTITYSVPPMF